MDTSIRPGQWQLTITHKSFNSSVLSFIGRYGSNDSPILVLDGGNCFNALEVAEAVNGDVEILKKISISRSFTCYQLASLLETTTLNNHTIFLLDFLSTFYDESAPFSDRNRLFQNCLNHIRRLSKTNSLLVINYPPAIPSPQTVGLVKKLEDAADEILPFELLMIELESIGDDDMGKTIPSFAQVFDKIQNSFSKFRRALRPPDKLAVDTLFAKARNHLSASALAARPLPFETILFCMIIEQQKEITRLNELVNKLNSGKK